MMMMMMIVMLVVQKKVARRASSPFLDTPTTCWGMTPVESEGWKVGFPKNLTWLTARKHLLRCKETCQQRQEESFLSCLFYTKFQERQPLLTFLYPNLQGHLGSFVQIRYLYNAGVSKTWPKYIQTLKSCPKPCWHGWKDPRFVEASSYWTRAGSVYLTDLAKAGVLEVVI